MNLEHVINEALELNVIKDGDLKLPIDQVVVRNYDDDRKNVRAARELGLKNLKVVQAHEAQLDDTRAK